MAWPGLELAGEADTRKRYRRWTDRLCTPEETWKRIRGLLGEFGITRVADLTGLDRVGLPIYAAYRPLSLCLVTSLGKGATHAAARVSAAMEAIEKRAAERPAASMRRATLRELSGERVVDVARLPRLRAEGLGRDVPILWVEGHELGSGEPCWVPHERVTTDYSALADPERDIFVATTTGLASGNTLPEATVHALCEAIEHDARALWWLSGHRRRHDLRLDLATVDDPECRAVIDRLDAAGVQAAVWDIANDVGVAAFACRVIDPSEADEFAIASASGAGCHTRREVALIRALTEAAQSRLALISGARDDFFWSTYAHATSSEVLAEMRESFLTAGHRDFDEAPTREAESIADDLEWLRARLAKAGMGEPAIVDLSARGVPVVRAIVPGLEERAPHGVHVSSARARAALADARAAA
jgi:YcaO-like protein with predicted kinase domain